MTFNEIEIACKFDKAPVLSTKVTISKVTGLFTVSPTSKLWAWTKDWEEPACSREFRSKMSTASGRELSCRNSGITSYPTVFECVFKLETSLSPADLLREVQQAFLKHLPQDVLDLDVYGAIDVGGRGVFLKMNAYVLGLEELSIVRRLSGWPGAIKKLGSRFDGAHGILFGRRSLCERLTEAVSLDRECVKSPCHLKGGARLGLIQIPTEYLAGSELVSIASECFVRKDGSTAYKAPPTVN
jgi:hypothetical protein